MNTKNTICLFTLFILLTIGTQFLTVNALAAPVNSNYIFIDNNDVKNLLTKEKDLTYLNSSQINKLKKTIAEIAEEKNRLSSDGKTNDKLSNTDNLPSTEQPLWLLRKAFYKGRVTGDSANFSISYDIESLTDKSFKYLPPSSDMVIKKATLNDKQVDLRLINQSPQTISQQNRPWLTIKGKGLHKIVFETIVPVSRFENIASLTLQTPYVPIASLELIIDERYASVDLVPSTNLKITHPSKEITLIKSRLPVHNSIFVKWNQHSRTAAKPDKTGLSQKTDQIEENKPLIFESNSYTKVTINDTTVKQTTSFAYEVKQGKLNQIKITVPENVEILDVSGSNILQWNHEKDSLIVKLETAYTDGYKLTVKSLYPLPPSTKFDKSTTSVKSILKGFETNGASTEKGYVSLLLNDEGELIPNMRDKITRIDPSELKKYLKKDKRLSPWLVGAKNDVAGKFISPEWNIVFQILRHKRTETSKISVLASKSLIRIINDGPILIQQSWTITNSGDQFFPVTLPKASGLMSCFVKGKPTDTGFVKSDDQNKTETLKIPLIKSSGQSGNYSSFTVKITYACWTPKTTLAGKLQIPLATVPYLVKTSKATVIGPEGYLINDDGGTMICETKSNFTKWFEDFSSNPVVWVLRPAGIFLYVVSGAAFFQATMSGGQAKSLLGSVDSNLTYASSEAGSYSPMKDGLAEYDKTADYERAEFKEKRESLYSEKRDMKQKVYRQKKFTGHLRKSKISEDSSFAIGGKGNRIPYPLDAPPKPAGEDTGEAERARFMATMTKNNNNKGNLPVEIKINEGTKGNQLVFTQELLTADNKENHNIEIFYIKNFVTPLLAIINAVLCFFIALILYEKLKLKQALKNLLLLLIVVTIIDLWLMYVLPNLDLLNHSLYAFYLAIPIYFVRKTDLWMTKSVAIFRKK